MYELSKIIFLDIETVPQYVSYEEISSDFKHIWNKKASFIDSERSAEELYFEKAGIYAEYGKVIVISLGFFSQTSEKLCFRTKSLYGHDEKKLLAEFQALISEKFKHPSYRFCAHNGKEFDYPYLCRRMIINQINIPPILQLMGKKPWQVEHLDTLELWKFGDYKHYTSLQTLTTIFGIESSKEDIDGSQVAQVYYHENGLERISRYCTNDVIATARVYLSYHHLGELKTEDIVEAN